MKITKEIMKNMTPAPYQEYEKEINIIFKKEPSRNSSVVKRHNN